MKTIAEFVKFAQSGQRPIVTFHKGVEEKECYAEAGMRARVLGVVINHNDDDVVSVQFSFEEFNEFNKPFESANYYGKDGVPNLTARQAGFYRPQDTIYFDNDELLSEQFTVVDDGGVRLHEQYRASGFDGHYVQWLEAQVLANNVTPA